MNIQEVLKQVQEGTLSAEQAEAIDRKSTRLNSSHRT